MTTGASAFWTRVAPYAVALVLVGPVLLGVGVVAARPMGAAGNVHSARAGNEALAAAGALSLAALRSPDGSRWAIASLAVARGVTETGAGEDAIASTEAEGGADGSLAREPIFHGLVAFAFLVICARLAAMKPRKVPRPRPGSPPVSGR